MLSVAEKLRSHAYAESIIVAVGRCASRGLETSHLSEGHPNSGRLRGRERRRLGRGKPFPTIQRRGLYLPARRRPRPYQTAGCIGALTSPATVRWPGRLLSFARSIHRYGPIAIRHTILLDQ